MINLLVLFVGIFTIGLRSVGASAHDLQSIETQVTGVHSNVVNTYTSGYLRAESFDTSVNPPMFVQAVSQVIGVCYQFRNGQDPVKFRKLTSVTLNSDNNQATLSYSNYITDNCAGTAFNSFTNTESITANVRASNSVVLRRVLTYTGSLTVALRILPGNTRGIEVQYFGAQAKCKRQPYKYRVATESCSNFPEFHGRIQCFENESVLRFTRYDYSPNLSCSSSPDVYRTQPFTCSKQGSDTDPSYELTSCLITDIKRPPKAAPTAPPTTGGDPLNETRRPTSPSKDSPPKEDPAKTAPPNMPKRTPPPMGGDPPPKEDPSKGQPPSQPKRTPPPMSGDPPPKEDPSKGQPPSQPKRTPPPMGGDPPPKEDPSKGQPPSQPKRTPPPMSGDPPPKNDPKETPAPTQPKREPRPPTSSRDRPTIWTKSPPGPTVAPSPASKDEPPDTAPRKRTPAPYVYTKRTPPPHEHKEKPPPPPGKEGPPPHDPKEGPPPPPGKEGPPPPPPKWLPPKKYPPKYPPPPPKDLPPKYTPP